MLCFFLTSKFDTLAFFRTSRERGDKFGILEKLENKKGNSIKFGEFGNVENYVKKH